VWVGWDAFVTAAHCVASKADGERVAFAARGDVDTDVEALRFGTLERRDEAHDLALLRVKLPPAHEVAELSSPSVGQNVQTMGHPLGLWWSYSAGHVAAIRYDADEDMWEVQATAPISPGNSGGGLFDEDGNLLGIAHTYMPRGENVNFFIHSTYVKQLIIRDVRDDR
jgi:S1-C subfamily serine protease